jgi:hypothetical protein
MPQKGLSRRVRALCLMYPEKLFYRDASASAIRRKNVVLVGHLPYLCRLLSSLLLVDEDLPVIEFYMGGVICLERGEKGTYRLASISSGAPARNLTKACSSRYLFAGLGTTLALSTSPN